MIGDVYADITVITPAIEEVYVGITKAQGVYTHKPLNTSRWCIWHIVFLRSDTTFFL